MKKLILFFFFIYTLSCLAYEQDSTEIVEYDSLTLISKNSYKDGFDFIVGGGLGITTGSVWDKCENRFSIGPVATVGLEIPLLESEIIAIEFYGHYWISEYKKKHIDNEAYIKIVENYYSQMGLSANIKCYLEDNTNKFRVAFHAGFVFFCPSDHYRPLDLGIGLHYRLDENKSISLSRRIMFILPD